MNLKINPIKLVPLPIAGVILSFFGLALFFKDYSIEFSYLWICIGVILIFLLLLKFIFFNSEFRKDLKNPIILGTFGTFPMALMILSVFIADFNYIIAFCLWLIAFLGHCLLITYFTTKAIRDFNLKQVFTNYFVVYIGVGMGAITGSNFHLTFLVNGIFIFAFFAMIPSIILVSYKYINSTDIDESLKPLVCIYAAPFSLLLCAYFKTTFINEGFIVILFTLSVIFYVFALIKAIQYVRLSFFPTFSSFTFPFIISATATKQIMNFFKVDLGIFLAIQLIIAIIFILFVLIRYIQFIFYQPTIKVLVKE